VLFHFLITNQNRTKRASNRSPGAKSVPHACCFDRSRVASRRRNATSTDSRYIGLCRSRRRSSSPYEFQGLPYHRPRPYHPPPPSSRTTTKMTRSVVISMGSSYSGRYDFHAPHDALQLKATLLNRFLFRKPAAAITTYQLASMIYDQRSQQPRRSREGHRQEHFEVPCTIRATTTSRSIVRSVVFLHSLSCRSEIVT
jgi:hypothetical protein